MNTPRLIVTSGEPAGIGPDLCLMLANHCFEGAVSLVILADIEMLRARAQSLNLDIAIELIPSLEDAPNHPGDGHLYVWHIPLNEPTQAGTLNPANAPYVLKQLALAAQLCLDHTADGIVTAPVHKGVINDAGVSFSGHTEFFAEKTGCDLPVMMLATPGLRVALATTHIPLKDVSDALTRNVLTRVIDITIRDLQTKFGIHHPRLLICGLNPHAGEGGHLGREEIDTIIPVIESYRDLSATLIGPLPADTLFTPKYLDQADAVLAMYHDQGLPVLKHKGFGNAVNITLGLPIIRTSVDHGTALDLAGTGQADPGSLMVAVNQAILLANTQQRVN